MLQKNLRAIAIALLGLALLMPGIPLPGAPSGVAEAADEGSILPDQVPVWADDYESIDHVYIPPGGLVGVEVSGGAVRLVTGSMVGWIASETITCPEGFRYDYVVLEAETPGNSRVEISILDSTKEASEVGYANATIPNFVKVATTDLSVYPIGPSAYPEVRIQVNLVADGLDRPRLLSTTLHYIGLEEWRDDFTGPGKMAEHRGLNFTDGGLEVNLTSKGSAPGTSVYEDFPAVVFGASTSGVQVAYPNAARTSYEDLEKLSILGYGYGLDIGDLDGDGYLDLVVAEGSTYGVQLFWGDSSGEWTSTSSTSIAFTSANEIAIGDYNGDGWSDIFVAAYSTSTTASSAIYLNQGNGEFNTQADVVFTDVETRYAASGDIDLDGYDDLVFIVFGEVQFHMGSDQGPDATADQTISVSSNGLVLEDLDQDGYLDLALADRVSQRSNVYMGDDGGIDTVSDYQLQFDATWLYDLAAGDFNGDGHKEIVYLGLESNDFYLYIFKGSATGWSSSQVHDSFQTDYCYDIEIADLDNDGKDDIVLGHYSSSSASYQWSYVQGSDAWPTTYTRTWDGYYVGDIGVAIPKAGGGTRTYRGSFTTEEIHLPQTKRWDMLALVGTIPQNTTATITIMDAQGRAIPGYQDLSEMNVDLSGILWGNTISVKVTVTSEFNWTTPVLESIVVKWHDEMLWRDEFYGLAKVDTLLNMEVTGGALVPRLPSSGTVPMMFAEFDKTDQPGLASISSGFGESSFHNLGVDLDVPKYMSALDVEDVNGDGYLDVAFARTWVHPTSFQAKSPLYLGHPAGFRPVPDHEFATVGAVDVLLEDLNADGFTDVVFAQIRDGNNYGINSTLFWGHANGWNEDPDVEFPTTGASAVEAADLDGDGLLDLAFACYKGSSTSTDSMVFIQKATGFGGDAPDHRLATKGAQGVAIADIDGDGNLDLAFANSFSGGYTEIDSYVYWGLADGSFDPTPSTVPTVGAEDVRAADLDGDGRMDLVFANRQDNSQQTGIESFVYMGDGTRSLPAQPDFTLPTDGAAAVDVADLDGKGWLDIVFACTEGSSLVYLSETAGYTAIPSMTVPTQDARDVDLTRWIQPGQVAYLSDAITLDPSQVGALDTLSWVADVAASVQGRVSIVDAATWEELASADLVDGDHRWDVSEHFKLKEHGSIRVMVSTAGIQSEADLSVYLLSLNWTQRQFLPPIVRDVHVSGDSVYRTQTVILTLEVFDEFDPARDLRLTVNSRLNGTDEWTFKTVSKLSFDGENWIVDIRPKVDAPTGLYDYRVRVRDTDDMLSADFIYEGLVTVLNNLPTEPKVQLLPSRPVSTSTISVDLVTSSSDIEANALTYVYRWYRDGQLVEGLTEDSVPPSMLSRGENWSVEVSAFDGEEEGPRAKAWTLVHNAAPVIRNHLPDPELLEDTTDNEWLDLSAAFEDPDGDWVSWSVGSAPEHISVSIDQETGAVTIVPDPDWNGVENVTFVASDGELQVSQRVQVIVLPVNDLPKFVAVDGSPIVSEPVMYTLQQGGLLVIDVTVLDVEGDELVFSVNTTAVQVDDRTGEIRFQPGIDVVGTLRFGLKVYDLVSPDRKVSLNFTITVENENDPMDDPEITHPYDGDSFKVNNTFYMSADCFDPDVQFGQVLNYTWTSSISGLLGYGATLSTSIPDPGDHVITLTVNDGEFQKTTFINLVVLPQDIIDPDPDPDPDPEPTGRGDGGGLPAWMLALVLAVLGAAGAAGYLAVSRRGTEEEEEDLPVMGEKEALRAIADMAKEAADTLEESKNGDAEKDDVWVETETKEGIEVDNAELAPTHLSMEATVTTEASSEVQALFKDIEANGFHATEEDAEQLRIDTMKRKYHNAIGQLPYGIPSAQLRERDWTDLAAALTLGEKRTLEDGREVTDIDGRWYYSDHEDSSTFLKEHGAKESKARPRTSTTGKEALLAKLEERFILGEISEETYLELKEKYAED